MNLNIFSSGVKISKSRSVSFPLDPAEKQRIQARMLARLLKMFTISRKNQYCLRKVSEWRRMSKEGMRNNCEGPFSKDVSILSSYFSFMIFQSLSDYKLRLIN